MPATHPLPPDPALVDAVVATCEELARRLTVAAGTCRDGAAAVRGAVERPDWTGVAAAAAATAGRSLVTRLDAATAALLADARRAGLLADAARHDLARRQALGTTVRTLLGRAVRLPGEVLGDGLAHVPGPAGWPLPRLGGEVLHVLSAAAHGARP